MNSSCALSQFYGFTLVLPLRAAVQNFKERKVLLRCPSMERLVTVVTPTIPENKIVLEKQHTSRGLVFSSTDAYVCHEQGDEACNQNQ